MICKSTTRKYCKDYTRIENYEEAIKDTTRTWHCHHRLETHNSDGERRLVDISRKELKALNMYCDRPPQELIFLTNAEHGKLHSKGKRMSEEARRKLSEFHKGMKASEETKRKISRTSKGRENYWKGKKLSEEHRKHLAGSHKGQHKGMHWKLVDGKRVWY